MFFFSKGRRSANKFRKIRKLADLANVAFCGFICGPDLFFSFPDLKIPQIRKYMLFLLKIL
jgi:hypothetical protein